MRAIVLLIALLAVLGAAEEKDVAADDAHAKFLACGKDLKCQKKYLSVYERDTMQRLRTLLLEEDLRNQEEAGAKARKCLKMDKGAKQDSCLRMVREKELMRKELLMDRISQQQGAEAYTQCKALESKHGYDVVHQCQRRVKLEAAHRTRLVEQHITLARMSKVLDDVKDTAAFAPLMLEASKCSTVACQSDLIRVKCHGEGAHLTRCVRTILHVPLKLQSSSHLESIR